MRIAWFDGVGTSDGGAHVCALADEECRRGGAVHNADNSDACPLSRDSEKVWSELACRSAANFLELCEIVNGASVMEKLKPLRYSYKLRHPV
jgi:hypothetical protein